MQAIQIAEGAVPTLVCPEGKVGLHLIYNDSDAVIYFAFDGDGEVTTETGIPLNPGERWPHEPHKFTGPNWQPAPAIYAVHGGVGNKKIRYGRT